MCCGLRFGLVDVANEIPQLTDPGTSVDLCFCLNWAKINLPCTSVDALAAVIIVISLFRLADFSLKFQIEVYRNAEEPSKYIINTN